MVKKAATHTEEDEETEQPLGIEYALPNLLEKFNRRWDEDVSCGKIKPDEFRKEMSLKEFSDKFEIRWSSGENPRLILSSRSAQRSKGCFYYPIRLKPHLNDKNANPKSPRYWLFCKHLCLWLTTCKLLTDLLPEPTKPQEELQDYWTNKFDELVTQDLSAIPKWVKAYRNKYIKDDASSTSSSDSEIEDTRVEESDITNVPLN